MPGSAGIALCGSKLKEGPLWKKVFFYVLACANEGWDMFLFDSLNVFLSISLSIRSGSGCLVYWAKFGTVHRKISHNIT